MPSVELSVNELKVLHSALEAFIQSGASGLQDCDCRLLYDRVHKILSWGSGYHLPYPRHPAVPTK